MTVILKVRNLKKYYGEVRAVDDVSFDVNKGEILSIVGPNGAGKTTLLNLISGFLKPDSGQIIFKNKNIAGRSPAKLAKEGIVKSFQLINLFENLSVFDSMTVAIISKSNKVFNIHKLVDRDAVIKREAEEILKTFNLYDKKAMLVKNLPHGDKKLLDVALAYALRPELLLLDEPTSGVSSREKHEVMNIIKSTIKDRGYTAIIVEHDMDIVFSYSDRIIAMADGRIIAIGRPEEIRSNVEVVERIIGVRKF